MHDDNHGPEHAEQTVSGAPVASSGASGPGAGPLEVSNTPTAPPRAPAPTGYVERAAYDDALSRLAIAESRLARIEQENRAFVGSMHHAADHTEQMIQQARAEAEAMRAQAAQELAATRAQIHDHRAAYLEQVQREAMQVIAEARAAAHEMMVVARADAREAVHEERRKVAGELEMLAAVRERISEERRALTTFHSQMSGRLRQLVHAMVEFSGEPSVPPGAAFANTVLTGPRRPEGMPTGTMPPPAVRAPGHDAPSSEAVATELRTFPPSDRSAIHADDAHLDQAFERFFSEDVEHEPSRRWILEE